MLLIFSIKARARVVARGEFNCPECNQRERFIHRQVREYAYYYFIRLWRIRDVGEYVQCRYCKTHFPPDIVNYSPRKALEQAAAKFSVCVRALLILVSEAPADENIHTNAEDAPQLREARYDAICKAMLKLTSTVITRADVQASIPKVQGRLDTAMTTLSQLNPILKPEDRLNILNAMTAVASVCGPISRNAWQIIAQAASVIGVPIESLRDHQPAMERSLRPESDETDIS